MSLERKQTRGERRLHVLAGHGLDLSTGLGQQFSVPRAGALGVALAHDLADGLDARGQLDHMAFAFWAVAVQQRIAGLAAQHRTQLP